MKVSLGFKFLLQLGLATKSLILNIVILNLRLMYETIIFY